MNNNIQYYVVDVETNGLRNSYHEINEVSLIRCIDKVQLTQFIKCESPEHSSYDALRITGKTLADLSKGSSREEAVEKIDKFLNEDGSSRVGRCFIGHNIINFDKKFLHTLYESVGKELQVNLWMDTLSMIKAYAKQNNLKGPFNLHASCDLMNIKKLSAAHASKIDTRNTYFLYKELINKMDYLPFIKTAVHKITSDDEEYLDVDLLDM